MAKKKHGWVREGGRWVRYVNGKKTRSQLPGPLDELGRRLKRLPRDTKTVAFNAAKDIQSSLTYKDNQTTGSPETKQVTKTKDRKAKKSEEKTPKTKLPTTAVTKTIKKSRDYEAEKKAKQNTKLQSAPKPKPKTAAQIAHNRAVAKDSRNQTYRDHIKAGRIKEAEELGKQIAADTRKKAPKNQFRVPQGAERKDRLSKQVAELKAMGKKKEKEKKKQSKANKAGWPGNRNY